jgi:predicted alpha/beta hydrolase family esterase
VPSPEGLAPTVVAPFIDHPRRIDALPGVETIVFDGEDDPYAPNGVRGDYEVDASIPVELVPGGGHLIPDSGFGPWPRIREWATAAKLGA